MQYPLTVLDDVSVQAVMISCLKKNYDSTFSDANICVTLGLHCHRPQKRKHFFNHNQPLGIEMCLSYQCRPSVLQTAGLVMGFISISIGFLPFQFLPIRLSTCVHLRGLGLKVTPRLRPQIRLWSW